MVLVVAAVAPRAALAVDNDSGAIRAAGGPQTDPQQAGAGVPSSPAGPDSAKGTVAGDQDLPELSGTTSAGGSMVDVRTRALTTVVMERGADGTMHMKCVSGEATGSTEAVR